MTDIITIGKTTLKAVEQPNGTYLYYQISGNSAYIFNQDHARKLADFINMHRGGEQ